MDIRTEYVKKKDAKIRELAEKVAYYYNGEIIKRKDYKYKIIVNDIFLTELYLTKQSIRFEFKELPRNCDEREVKLHDSKRYDELGYIYYFDFPDNDYEGAFEFATRLKGIRLV